MREIVTTCEMKALDRNTIETAGIPSLVLMERAALKTAEELRKRLKNESRERILVVCGSGNNGGDGAGNCQAFASGRDRNLFLSGGKRRADDRRNEMSVKSSQILWCFTGA